MLSRRTIMSSGTPHVRWIDNFNKIYAYQMASLNKGSYASLMWMGAGFRLLRQPGKVTDLLTEPGKPAMPEDLFDNAVRVTFHRLMKKVCEHARTCTLEASDCTKYQINNIPLKPVVKEQDNPELHALLKSSPDGLATFRQEAVYPIHIGSNGGIAKVFREVHDKCLADPPQAKLYRLMVADGNIFSRALKVRNLLHDFTRRKKAVVSNV